MRIYGLLLCLHCRFYSQCCFYVPFMSPFLLCLSQDFIYLSRYGLFNGWMCNSLVCSYKEPMRFCVFNLSTCLSGSYLVFFLLFTKVIHCIMIWIESGCCIVVLSCIWIILLWPIGNFLYLISCSFDSISGLFHLWCRAHFYRIMQVY